MSRVLRIFAMAHDAFRFRSSDGLVSSLKRHWPTLAICFALISTPSFASQVNPNPDPPPVVAGVGQGGYGLISGTYIYTATEVVIGRADAGGLTFSRTFNGGGFRDNYAGTINSSGSTYTVSIGDNSETFTLSGSVFSSDQELGSTLSYNSGTGIYTYTLKDGTVALFATSLANGGSVYNANVARITTLTKPTGQKTLWYYKSVTVQSVAAMRLQSVTNNLGYQIHFDYSLNNPTLSSQLPAWTTLAKATGINNAVDYCDPTVDSCPAYTVTWPSAAYGTSGVYSTVTDNLSRVWKYSSGTYGLAGIVRPSGNGIGISYNTSGQVSGIANSLGTTTYTYVDVSGQRTTTITDPLSHTRVLVSNIAALEILTDTNGVGKATSYQYDAFRHITRVTQPEGNYTSYTYDGRGNITQTTVVAKSGSGVADVNTYAGYDTTCTNPVTCNEPNNTTDARGFRTDYTYDPTHGGVLTATQPAPSGAAPVGSGTRPQDRSSYTALYAYYKNSSGVIVAAATPVFQLTGTSSCATTASCSGGADETVSAITYGSTGVANNLLPTLFSKGAGDGSLTATRTIVYDSIGNLYTIDGPLAGSSDTTRYRFDADRELVGVVGPDPDGAGPLKNRAVRNTYNADGQITLVERGTVNSQSDPDWSTFATLLQQTTAYDADGRPISRTLVGGGATQTVTQYSYDNAGRQDCTTIRMNPSVFGSLPTSACTLTLVGPNYGADRVTRNTYDNANRPIQVTQGYGSPTPITDRTLTYTDNGLVSTLADANNNLTTYVYDGDDRRVKIRFPNASGGGSSTTDAEQYAYDPSSNVTLDTRRDGTTITFSIDNLNRVSQSTPSSNGNTVSNTYDNFGRRLTETISGGQTLTFSYDQLSRNLTQQSSVLGTVSYQYDSAGRRTRVTWPDALYEQYDYDLGNDLTAIRENGAASGLGVLAAYTFDDLGRETLLARGNGTTETPAYDNASNLSSLTQDLLGTANDQTLTLTYNPAHQVGPRVATNTAYQWNPTAPGTQSYAPNGRNQYGTVGGTSYSYDTRANLTSDGTHAYTYDIDNHLVTGPNSASLSYDPAGRLYQTSATGFSTARLLYDGGKIIGEFDTGGTLQRRYVWGLSGPIVWYEGSGTATRRWLIPDDHGSIISVTDATGAAIATNSYDEYGQPGSANSGRFQYAGQPWIAEIGLYQMGARAYAPGIGRFLQTDPILTEGGMNIYAYVGNDPLNGFDPSGMDLVSGSVCGGATDICSIVPGDGYQNGPEGPGGPFAPQTESSTMSGPNGNTSQPSPAGAPDYPKSDGQPTPIVPVQGSQAIGDTPDYPASWGYPTPVITVSGSPDCPGCYQVASNTSWTPSPILPACQHAYLVCRANKEAWHRQNGISHPSNDNDATGIPPRSCGGSFQRCQQIDQQQNSVPPGDRGGGLIRFPDGTIVTWPPGGGRPTVDPALPGQWPWF